MQFCPEMRIKLGDVEKVNLTANYAKIYAKDTKIDNYR
jgi:hypothetical protein